MIHVIYIYTKKTLLPFMATNIFSATLIFSGMKSNSTINGVSKKSTYLFPSFSFSRNINVKQWITFRVKANKFPVTCKNKIKLCHQ